MNRVGTDSKTETQYLNRIGLGTVQFGMEYGIRNHYGQPSQNEIESIISLFQSNGGDMLDTSSAYGDCLQVLGSTGIAKNVEVISKIRPGTSMKSMKEEFENQMKELKVSQINGMLIHLFDDYKKQPELFDFLEEKKATGEIQKIGFSLYYPQELELVLQRGIVPDVVQIPFSAMDRRFEQYLEELSQKGIEVHIRSAFLQGLLFFKIQNLPEYFSFLKPQFRALDLYCLENKVSRLEVLLSAVLSYSTISKVIVGVNKAKELQEIIDACKKFLNSPRQHKIDFLKIDEEKYLNPALWPRS